MKLIPGIEVKLILKHICVRSFSFAFLQSPLRTQMVISASGMWILSGGA